MDKEAAPASAYVTVEHDGWIAESNTHTEEQLRTALGAPSVDEETSAAAKKLGEKGGKAAAEANKAKPAKKEKAKPEPAAEAEDEEGAEPEKKPEAKAEEDNEEAEAEAKDQRKRDARQRVIEATREAAELKRENRRLQEEIAAARKPAETPREQPKPQDDDPEPNPDDSKYADGQFDPAYIKDAGRWAARQEFREQQTKTAQKTRQEGLQRYVEERGALVDKAIQDEGGDDFLESLADEVRSLEPSFLALSKGIRPGPANALADEFLRMGDQAPRLMRFLTEHPEVLQRLTTPTLRPSEFEREMGRIEERLSAATAGTPAPKPISKAPKPARPVAGAPTNADSAPDPRSSSYDEHVGYYNAKERRRTA